VHLVALDCATVLRAAALMIVVLRVLTLGFSQVVGTVVTNFGIMKKK
jgi:hypothetical protein